MSASAVLFHDIFTQAFNLNLDQRMQFIKLNQERTKRDSQLAEAAKQKQNKYNKISAIIVQSQSFLVYENTSKTQKSSNIQTVAGWYTIRTCLTIFSIL